MHGASEVAAGRPGLAGTCGGEPAPRSAESLVIAFGVAVTDPEQYQRWRGAGIERVGEPDSAAHPNIGSEAFFRNYKLLLDLAAKHDDLEAPGHGDRRPELHRQAAQELLKPGRGDRGLRRITRRAKHCLVAGECHLGLVHPPLPRVRWRRPAFRLSRRSSRERGARLGASRPRGSAPAGRPRRSAA